DLIKTVKAQLYDRLTSPLLGCFLLSWVIWNYKFIFTLFSDMKIEDKFKFIDGSIYSGDYSHLIYGLLLPFVTTLFFIFIYPYPAKFAYAFFRKRQVELKEIQQKIDDETPLTRDEARKIRSDAVKMSIEFEQEIEKLREENLSLRNIIKKINDNQDVDSTNMSEKQVSTRVNREEKITPDDEQSYNYEPFFDKNSSVQGNSRLLITGPEHIKASVENHINSDKKFNGHTFMVNIDGKYVSINLISKNGRVKPFKYDYRIPENGKIGYESMRIINSFDEDFIRYLNNKNPEQLENE
ncbi:TPA: hypothetical protein ACIS18_003579, partial [Salmonella enterica subsp. enterica serovar Birkenhead]|nr:hypothetical protein [Salmonella enterica subsp. enterica serovar Worthington]